MEIRVLQYFLALAREESITKAAESLHMTQPPLSRQLKELEAELGKQLFIRGSKKITLTEDGMLLKKRAEEMMELMEKTKAELSSDDKIGGDIYIGGGETEAMSAIAEVAQSFQKEYPLIRYHLHSGDGETVTERLDKGLLDFGLLVEPYNLSKYDYIKLPIKDTWGVLMLKSSELADKDTVKAEDLWDKPLLLSNQVAMGRSAAKWLRRDLSKLNIVATYNLLYNASRFVKSGLGYAITLDGLINTEGSEMCFKPLEPATCAELYVVWKKYQVFSKAAEKFLCRLKEEFDKYDNI